MQESEESKAGAGPARVPARRRGADSRLARVATREIRGSLKVIAFVAMVWLLGFGKHFFVPLAAGAVLALALMPIVNVLERWRFPVALSATLLIFGTLAASGFIIMATADDAVRIVQRAPELMTNTYKTMLRLTPGLGSVMGDRSAGEKLVEQSTPERELTRASAPARHAPERSGNPREAREARDPRRPASGLGAATPGAQGAGASDLDQKDAKLPAPLENIGSYVGGAASVVAASVGELMVILLVAYFLMLNADRMKLKMVSLVGESIAERKIALRAMLESRRQIQLHLMITAGANIAIGLSGWLFLHLMGVRDAGPWALAIGLLHTIPYVGTAVGTLLVGVATLLQFENWGMSLQVAVGIVIISSLVGTLVTTFLQGRVSSINAAVVFVGVLFFTWLWGAWGLLLGAPIMAIAKVMADHWGATRISTILEA